MRELETLTCLVIILYDAPNVPSCPYHEHGDLIDAIEARDERARRRAHGRAPASTSKRSLNFERRRDGEIDFEAVFVRRSRT